MGKHGVKAAVFGILCNLSLFLIKLYVSISTNSLTVYCDAVNSMGDILSCFIALLGFAFAIKASEKKSGRIQALCSFVIGIIIAVAGAYCAYSGLERFMYPLPVYYSVNYAALICVTAAVKIVMGFVYFMSNKKNPSPVLRALILDCILDFILTAVAITGFYLVQKINYAIDGVIGIAMGAVIFAAAVKETFKQAKALVND